MERWQGPASDASAQTSSALFKLLSLEFDRGSRELERLHFFFSFQRQNNSNEWIMEYGLKEKKGQIFSEEGRGK